MIANVTGTLTTRDDDQIVIETEGGVGYAITVPLGVFERLPLPGSRVRLFTELVVREDGWSLYGFDQPTERAIFRRLLGASGFGPRLALALLSTLGPDRAVRSIQDRDIAALATVNGIGKKKAEKLVVELQDRFKDFTPERATGRPAAAGDAVQALVSLGYSVAAAEEAVRHTLGDNGSEDAAHVVRGALQWIASSRGGKGA
ncbi:MAG: Holliday junction branch migration protein RuvA [Gemmatimonadales bacterium]